MYHWQLLRAAVLGIKVPYHQIRILGEDGGRDWGLACQKIHKALTLRDKYQYLLQEEPELSDVSDDSDESELSEEQRDQRRLEKIWRKRRQQRRRSSFMFNAVAVMRSARHRAVEFQMVDGVVRYTGQEKFPFSYEEHVLDIFGVTRVADDGPTKSSCRHRLTMLAHKYDIHNLMNSELEAGASTSRGGGDFYSARKVDNCIRLATCTPARSLHKFMMQKALEEPDTLVGRDTTLGDLFKRLGLSDPRKLTIERLGVQPGPQRLFHRFDVFSKDYSRGGAGTAALLEPFLRRGDGEGKWFADLVRPQVNATDAPGSTVATEYRIPLYGFDDSEWFNLAAWVEENNIHAENNRWIIQVIRIAGLRGLYRSCKTQQDQLDALFLPMWMASVYPENYPQLAKMLRYTTAINIICNESDRGQDLDPKAKPPKQWPWSENPPDLYFNYYVWANLASLNAYRHSVGLNVFQYRPTAGEMGSHIDHLVSAFLLADSIMQGVTMDKFPTLQYLYYIAQIGICMAPLSNNGMDRPYASHPFQKFFKRGLRVALGTEGPLHFHHTQQPVHEEYGTAIKLY
eukprot:RCo024053